MAKKTVVFHPGTQHSWQTAKALAEADRLAFYATSIFYQPHRWPYILERLPGPIGRALQREFARFDAAGLPADKVKTFGWHEWAERAARRSGRDRLAEQLNGRGNAAFGRKLGRMLDPAEVAAVWGYDSSSWEAFEAARTRDLATVLDVTTPHPRHIAAMMRQVRSDWPDWFDGPSRNGDDSAVERLDAELALANRVVVGSDAAAATLAEHGPSGTAAKTTVAPYSWNAALFDTPPQILRPSRSGPVRFLFVGQVAARKGLPFLLEAMRQFGREEASLTVVGGMDAPAAAIAPYEEGFTYHRHVPRAQIPAVMAEHDVLVLPSYYEGSAVVLLEALASGLGIIQSRAAGQGADATCGTVLDEVSVDRLAETMRRVIADRDLLHEWKRHAARRAQTFTFESYRDNIVQVLDRLGQPG